MERTQKRYPSDLTDAEWALIAPQLPTATFGRPRSVSMREVMNGIFFVLQTGAAWRAMPKDLPNHSTVYYYFAQWQRTGVIEQILDALRRQDRVRKGRHPEPTAGVIDSQTVKVGAKGGATASSAVGATTAASA